MIEVFINAVLPIFAVVAVGFAFGRTILLSTLGSLLTVTLMSQIG